MKNYLLVWGAALLLVACQVESGTNKHIVARVKDKVLYEDDLQAVVPKGATPQDSALLVKRYIDLWVRKQLLIQKALQETKIDEKALERKVEDYRNSLILFEFEEQYLEQHLDTLITQAELDSFYTKHQEEFKLQEPLVQVRLVELPAESKQLEDIKRKIKSNKPEDVSQLKAFCLQYALNCSLNDTNWVSLRQVLVATPFAEEENPGRLLQKGQVWEKATEAGVALLYVKDFLPAGATAPLEYVEDRIKEMIYNRRRIQAIQRLEEDVYKEAEQKKLFEIYEKNN
ncbi:MAG: hypothetical protein KatS3mg033_1480 [Thermonema sp.]|uniref:hypothetical protein n=1 Tax=Thermonema sp. TaxID=2231181 RepID=UPI0021DDB65A|nr:hypothetical protein [Thermonema sp.]GIV39680.1 MAG: hypothetical protein KatS3mg033_1480 [Thermonema sp.]